MKLRNSQKRRLVLCDDVQWWCQVHSFGCVCVGGWISGVLDHRRDAARWTLWKWFMGDISCVRGCNTLRFRSSVTFFSRIIMPFNVNSLRRKSVVYKVGARTYVNGVYVETSNTHQMRIKWAFVLVVISDYFFSTRKQSQRRCCQVPVIRKISLSKYVKSIRLNNTRRDEAELTKQLLSRINNDEKVQRWASFQWNIQSEAQKTKGKKIKKETRSCELKNPTASQYEGLLFSVISALGNLEWS